MPELIGMLAVGNYEDDENVPVPSGAYNYFIFSRADGLYTIDPDGVIAPIGSAAIDAASVSFVPTTASDWNGNTDPGNVDDALDQLAQRVTDNLWDMPLYTTYGSSIFSGMTYFPVLYYHSGDNEIRWDLQDSWSNIDNKAIHDNTSGEIAAVAEKTSLVGADKILIEDSQAANAKKMAQFSNVAAYVQDYIEEGSPNGWIPASETWVYASADDPTYTFTVSGVDLTSKYSPGMRVKWTQTTVKYAIITKVEFSTNTTITIYGGTDYDLANAAITSPYYSTSKAPVGFPLDPLKWTIITVDTNLQTQATPTQNTWYNTGSLSLVVPIGTWKIDFQAGAHAARGGIEANDIQICLSTANNSSSDGNLRAGMYTQSTQNLYSTFTRSKFINLSSKTTYYLNIRTTEPNPTNIYIRGDLHDTTISAVCAYL